MSKVIIAEGVQISSGDMFFNPRLPPTIRKRTLLVLQVLVLKNGFSLHSTKYEYNNKHCLLVDNNDTELLCQI